MALKLNTVSAKIEFEVIFVGDYGYVRLPGGEWQRLPRDQVDTSGAQLDAFEFLTSADDLAYDGTTTRDGEELYVLVNSRPLVLEGSGAAAEGAAGEMTRLQILVRPDGTPVYLSYHMTVTSTDASAPLVAIKGDIQQSFTDVGEPIVIEPPASFTK